MNTSFINSIAIPGRQRWLTALDFALPPELEAAVPPEERGLRRDQIRIMVSYRRSSKIIHSRFDQLSHYLKAGDTLVINTSKTLKAALKVLRLDGTVLELHLSTRLTSRQWVIELRTIGEDGTLPFYEAVSKERLCLPGGGIAILDAPYPGNSNRKRLWVASLKLPEPLHQYLEHYGFPIRYKYVRTGWPIEYYQNVYAAEPGSAEMPSAGRPFTPELITELIAQGVRFAPLVLHTGVASLERDEKPYEEYYRVPPATASLINLTRSEKGRVIAVGTTVIRAVQTVTGLNGMVKAGEGWTGLVVTPETQLASIDGLLTGLHEPRSSHLSILFALAGREHIRLAYEQALQNNYLWHEFGDSHLILP